jgi:hypothetical protein
MALIGVAEIAYTRLTLTATARSMAECTGERFSASSPDGISLELSLGLEGQTAR